MPKYGVFILTNPYQLEAGQQIDTLFLNSQKFEGYEAVWFCNTCLAVSLGLPAF